MRSRTLRFLINVLLYLETGNVGKIRITFHFAEIERQIQRDFRVKRSFEQKNNNFPNTITKQNQCVYMYTSNHG
jgi:hypothetical protein